MKTMCLKDLDLSSKFALIPVSGDCLERAGIYDGDFVEVAIGRYPRPPVYKSQAGYELHDICLCYRLDHAKVTDNPPLLLKTYVGVFCGRHEISTMYRKQRRVLDFAFPARILGVVYGVHDKNAVTRWRCSPKVFPLSLGTEDTITVAEGGKAWLI